ncbi:hypothetical protein PHYBOEH_003854 [Phytophthora boehmeriae]|uniref:Transcription factor CBF/NF-Y/archaeal histone domain-containing protein n=1 Tax=Phytophthora boehmeriae TaxID=109152 RepID=A0A8T1XA78_9STRA|nr:hypothetical protein PHYBOEH_003854 [Phytophthora boehmeriae]
MKQRDVLKGRVKRLLREQKDMGQVGESAVLSCSSALQVFVRDLAHKMQQQTAKGSANGLTPIELKKSVVATEELKFLHEKVAAIDESAAKYHKPTRGRKRPLTTGAKKPSKRTMTAKSATTVSTLAKTGPATDGRMQDDTPETAPETAPEKRTEDACKSVKPVAASSTAKALEVDEDDNYDESDSDE